ncbi:MAG: Rsd/AlgQ family anti-sigma factor [Pseudomonadota bacterium]
MNTSTVERRSQSHQLIDELISLRTEMLTLYGVLASNRPFEANSEILNMVQEFCQSLVDYTADGHFSIYRFIAENKERRKSVLDVAQKVYPKIAETTDIILAFNDKYDSDEHCQESLNALEKDLSYLGEVLADRIEQEDQIVGALRKGR